MSIRRVKVNIQLQIDMFKWGLCIMKIAPKKDFIFFKIWTFKILEWIKLLKFEIGNNIKFISKKKVL